MSYRPLPPMMPIVMDMCVVNCRVRRSGASVADDRLDEPLAIRLADVSRRDVGIVLEEYQIFPLDRLADEGPLERERVHRIEVVAHHPGAVDVGGGRDEIGGEHGGTPFGLEVDDLVVHGVAAGADHAHPRYHLRVALMEIEHSGLLQ